MEEKDIKRKKRRKTFLPPKMNLHLNSNEKYKAFKIEKSENNGPVDPRNLKKIPLVSYRNDLYELNNETKLVERIDKMAAWQNYTITVLPEESPMSSSLSWIWDKTAHKELKEFYFKENKKMLYYFLNDVKKAAKYHFREVSFNKESFEKYKNNKSLEPPNLVITLDRLERKIPKDEEYNPNDAFVDEIINLFIDTGLYDKEKEGKLVIAREVYFTK